MIAIYLFTVLTFLLVLRFLWRQRKYYKLMFELPGPKGFPLLGAIPQLILCGQNGIVKLSKDYLEKYGSVMLTWVGPIPFILTTDPQTIQDVLTAPQCNNKSFIYDQFAKITGSGLLFSYEPEWSRHRKLLNPAFKHKILLSFMPIFHKEIDRLMKTLDVYAENENEINLSNSFFKLAMDVSTQTTMGVDISESKSKSKNLNHSLKIIAGWVMDYFMYPWLHFEWVQRCAGIHGQLSKAKQYSHEFLTTMIKRNLQNKHESNSSAEIEKDKNIFIDIAIDLLKTGEFTYQDVKNEAFIIVFAAVDTSANTILHAIILLAMFPQYQEKAYEEVVSLFPNRGNFDVSYYEMQQCSYLDMVINETLRIMATIPLIARAVAEDFQLSNGIVLPKGTQIAIDIFTMHRREDIWGPEAHIFNPNNFLPTNLEGKHSYSFMPFSKGNRYCIGFKYAQMLLKVSLIKLIRNYQFTTNADFNQLKFIPNILLNLKETPLLKLHKRE